MSCTVVVAAAAGACGKISKDDPNHVQVRSEDCVVCHRSDYDGATTPPHAGVFPLTCANCHGQDSWSPAKFDHSWWELTGKHAQIPCVSCHTGDPPVYQGTPTECVGCHQADYDSSPFPGHQSFPTTCADCHSTTAWKPAKGGHPESIFPLTNPHNMPCEDCHNASLGPNGKGNADCVGCHTGTHSRSNMDPKHSGVNGYPSGSAPPNFCLDCHPNGRNNN